MHTKPGRLTLALHQLQRSWALLGALVVVAGCSPRAPPCRYLCDYYLPCEIEDLKRVGNQCNWDAEDETRRRCYLDCTEVLWEEFDDVIPDIKACVRCMKADVGDSCDWHYDGPRTYSGQGTDPYTVDGLVACQDECTAPRQVNLFFQRFKSEWNYYDDLECFHPSDTSSY